MYAAWDVAAIRAAEAAAMGDHDDGTLMARAARGLAVETARQLRATTGGVSGRRILALIGPGNNGGDALFACSWLASRGVQVRWCAVAGGVHQRGVETLRAAGGREVSPASAALCVDRCDLVLDGIVGIGGRAGLPERLVEVGNAVAASGAQVVSVDLPSGLAADSATATAGTFLAAHRTITFGGRKLCQVLEPAASACGEVTLIDIGLDMPSPTLRCWEPADVAHRWPVPGPTSHKYSRGVVAVDAGSSTYPGAGVLAATGAVYAGAGMVRFIGPANVRDQVLTRLPNVVAGPGRVQAAVLGPGWGERDDAATMVSQWLDASDVAVVIDADALRHLPAGARRPGVVLTPHAGELARLLGRERADVEADPVGAVRDAVAQTGATVLLKGATQLVAGPDSATIDVAVPGPAWTGQAGSGDVLSGVVGSLLAAGLPPRSAAAAGASVQAMAATANPGPIPPQRLAEHFPAVVASLVR